MRNFNIETPSGLHIRVEGSSIYYRMVCDFHVTKMRKFMERLEEVLVIRSIVFRDDSTYVSFSVSFDWRNVPVQELVSKAVNDTLP